MRIQERVPCTTCHGEREVVLEMVSGVSRLNPSEPVFSACGICGGTGARPCDCCGLKQAETVDSDDHAYCATCILQDAPLTLRGRLWLGLRAVLRKAERTAA